MLRLTQPRPRPSSWELCSAWAAEGGSPYAVLGDCGCFWNWPLGSVFWGVTARSNPGYNVCSCDALEWLHSASPDVLDRGTRLSPPVPFRSAFSCARQSLRQRLIFLSSRCFANRLSLLSFWLLALKPKQPLSVYAA